MEKTEEINPLDKLYFNNTDICRTEWNVNGRCVITIEMGEGCDLSDIIIQVKSTLIGLGFSSKNIEDYFNGEM